MDNYNGTNKTGNNTDRDSQDIVYQTLGQILAMINTIVKYNRYNNISLRSTQVTGRIYKWFHNRLRSFASGHTDN